MLMVPLRCWRGRDDCEPLHSIEAMPEDQTLEEYESPTFTPESFVCCGINHSGTREEGQLRAGALIGVYLLPEDARPGDAH